MIGNKFTYIEVVNPNAEEVGYYFLNKKLIELESKHFVSIEENQELNELANKVHYDYAVFGSHRHARVSDEKNRILNMKKALCNRAVRIVIDKYGRVWSDNTHWTISYILQLGSDTEIIDIPVYIVDFRQEIPSIVNINNTLFDSTESIIDAIECAKQIQIRVENGWRDLNISYQIKDLIKELAF